MRIVVDLQGAQSSGSRNRGIGRYSLALAEGLIRQRGDNQVVLALNGQFPDAVESLRAHFDSMLDQRDIRVWTGLTGVAELAASEEVHRRRASERLREAFIERQRPDAVLVTSLFEGLVDDTVTSIGHLPTSASSAVVLYDLIPLINRSPYLDNAAVARWYERKLQHLRRADLLLAISDSSRGEALTYLGTPPSDCVTISTAADPRFRPLAVASDEANALRKRLGLLRPFLMYTGGIDHRKNIEGLIRAYSKLPKELRLSHQLAVVCSVNEPDRQRLMALGATCGLASDELVLTGFVSDTDLLVLYNLCKLFVFPSWHEGFGLPALEAMSCGRPVIAAGTSSLPEVIGNSDAMFDPFSDDDIARKMGQVLQNPDFAQQLAQSGLERSGLFSWDITARRAWNALEAKLAQRRPVPIAPRRGTRPTLALVTPFKPERTGIADYNAELLPELARHYDITLVSDQEEMTDPWASAHVQMRTLEWLADHATRFDRVVYHMGNSHFHKHMFALMRRVPGVVVMHDFYLGQLVEYMHGTMLWPGVHAISLHRNHGYAAVAEWLNEGPAAASWKYPANLDVLQTALGIIVHSKTSCDLAARWYGPGCADAWAVIPQLRTPLPCADRARARDALGLRADDFVVCSFGMIGPSKLTLRLVESFADSALGRDVRSHLRLVGANDGGEYGRRVADAARASTVEGRIDITGWIDDATYRLYLAAADVAVQLRTNTRGETSRAVLDCMAAGLAVIVNDHGSLGELGGDAVVVLPDEFADSELAEALSGLRHDEAKRKAMAAAALARIHRDHQPRHCADLYAAAIERFHSAGARLGFLRTTDYVADDETPSLPVSHWVEVAGAIALNDPPEPRLAQLLIDVSVLAQVDAKTGIQRVVRSILAHWLAAPAQGYRVEPVYAAVDGKYRYARRFTLRFLGAGEIGLQDPEVDAYPGDHLLLLDLNLTQQPAHLAAQRQLRQRGIGVRYVVYDLLPVQMPHRFPEGVAELYQAWLTASTNSDGVICISRAVADEYAEWLRYFGPRREQALSIDWFHLGSDFGTTKPTRGVPSDSESILARLRQSTSIVMVGTLEPRKRQDLVLDAFETRWANGQMERLVIVGKEGWGCATLAARLRAHPESGKRLFWFDSASDEWLASIYASCRGLIAASEGEGFGLILVEARRHGLSLFARDIPVFREVAGEDATFSSFATEDALDADLAAWLETLGSSAGLGKSTAPARTWEESARDLWTCVLSQSPYRTWQHDGVHRFFGNDPRMRTNVGRYEGHTVRSKQQSGLLTFGPFIDLPAGSWEVEVFGRVQSGSVKGCHVEGTAAGGTRRLWEAALSATFRSGDPLLRVCFETQQDHTGFELRTHVTPAVDLVISSLVIRPRQAGASKAPAWPEEASAGAAVAR